MTKQTKHRFNWRRIRWSALVALGVLSAAAFVYSPSRQCVRVQTLTYTRTTYALVPERAAAAAEIYCMRNGNKAMRGEPELYHVPTGK